MKKIFFPLLTVALIFTTCSKNSMPEEPENIITQELFSLSEVRGMAVIVEFDMTKPDVAFIAPNEEVLNEKTVRFEKLDNAVKYFLPNADVGDWQISYTMKNNSEIKISYDTFLDSIKISDFRFGNVNQKYMPLYFFIESKINGTALFKLFAFSDTSDEVLLLEGSANLNYEFTDSVDISELADGGYKFRLDVTLKYGDEIAADSKIAQAFILTVKQIIED